MAEPAVNIEFNPANWVSVLIIVGVSFALFGFLTRLWQQKKAAEQAV